MNTYNEPEHINIYDDNFDNQKKVISENPYIENQKIKQKKNMPDWYKSIDDRKDRYDPLLNDITNSGTKDDSNILNQEIEYIDVNSAFREKTTNLFTKKEIILDDDPIKFFNNSNELIILIDNHNLKIGDKITINGVKTNFIKLRTKINSDNTIEFVENSQYMTINYNHGIPSTYSGTNIKILIKGVRGENGDNCIGNININSINTKHTVLIEKPIEDHIDSSEFNSSKFYVKLPRKFIGNYSPSIYNFKIKFNSIFCIPIHFINANYPLTPDNVIGFHTITDITSNSISIKVNEDSKTDSNSFIKGGGDNITISKINKIVNGYPNPNFYSITLPRTLNNIVSIQMISSEFTNSMTVFNENNNKLYWQNIEDGETLHKLSITPGNYSKNELETEIENRAFDIKRINISKSYNKEHFFSVNIDESTGRVEIINFKKAILTKSIQSINPVIQSIPSLDSFDDDTEFKITFAHKSHGLNVGDEIIISGATDHMGINSDNINGTHTIISVDSDDSYTFKLSKINLSDTRNSTGGGNSITVKVPTIFRMKFNEQDTCGEQLGFRNVGESFAITPYSTKITNYNEYINDITKDENGNNIIITNNQLKLQGDDYILMDIQNINNINSQGKLKNIFTKILLNGPKNSTLFNTFVEAKKIFSTPLTNINELEFSFYTQDGELIDFGGIDHSFTLEIKYLLETPAGTNISNTTSKHIKQENIVDIDY